MDLKDHGTIDKLDTMYPTIGCLISDGEFVPPGFSTTYGVVLEGSMQRSGTEWIAGEYFSVCGTEPFKSTGRVWLVSRVGFHGQEMTGHEIESTGRLTYIDNCSSTILVYPPRYGDPSLHLLHFPRNINQSLHTHPSIRMGLVYSGSGKATLLEDELDLLPGMMFCLDEQEIHRFTTGDSEMRIIAFHPDGNWGPTDEAHPMLNRTFLIR